MSAIPPVRKQVKVDLPAAEAFSLFTEGLSRWWPLATHSCFQKDAAQVTIEPRPGGSVTEHARDGRTSDWGKVIAWEPPHRFSMTWHPASDPKTPTQVEVMFTQEGRDHTVVTLLHTGWEIRGDKAQTIRDEYEGGWVGVLESYLQAAQRK